MERGESQHDKIGPDGNRAQKSLHRGKKADPLFVVQHTGDNGVGPSGAEQRISNIKQTGADHAFSTEKILRIGHGKGADIIPGKVNHVKGFFLHSAFWRAEIADAGCNEVAENSDSDNRQQRGLQFHLTKIHNYGARQCNVHHNAGNQAKMFRRKEMNAPQNIAQNNDCNK